MKITNCENCKVINTGWGGVVKKCLCNTGSFSGEGGWCFRTMILEEEKCPNYKPIEDMLEYKYKELYAKKNRLQKELAEIEKEFFNVCLELQKEMQG